MTIFVFRFESAELKAEAIDGPTARALVDAVPFEATVSTWGDEVYFPAPVRVETDPDARDVIQPGEIAFWTAGDCVAIGFGPTPASRGSEIRLASPANVWARALGDVAALRVVHAGERVRVDVES